MAKRSGLDLTRSSSSRVLHDSISWKNSSIAQVLFKWSQARVSSTDWKFGTNLYVQYNKQYYLAELLPCSIEWRHANFIHDMKSKKYPLPHDKRHQKKNSAL